MKILVVSQYFWPEHFHINEVVRSLTERGLQVDVLTGKPNYPQGDIYEGYQAGGTLQQQWEGATIFRVPLLPRGRRSRWRLLLNYLSFVLAGTIVGPWLLRRRSCDVVFAFGLSPIFLVIPAIFLSWIKRRRLVLWVQDLWPESLSATGYVRSRAVISIVGKLVGWIYRRCDLILVQSRAFEEPIRKLAPAVPIRYFPNSVNPAFADPEAAGVETPCVPQMLEGFPVMFAGNVGAAQGVDVIIEAAVLLNEHPDIRFVIFGTGSRWEWLNQQVTLRGLRNVFLVGQYPVDTMPGLMRQAAALLVTLTDRPIFAATVPSKVQAYLASGRPIVACLNGEGARIVAEAEAGISVPAEDAAALAAALLKLYEMPPQQREKLGRNGRAYFKANFDHDRLVEELTGHLAAEA